MKHWRHWVRVGVGMALIVLLIVQFAEIQSVWMTVLSAHPLPLIGCVVIYFIGVALSCIKWQLLLRAQGIQVSLSSLVLWYLMGSLAGILLPSDVGGDVGRGYAAARALGDSTAVWSSVVMERFTGLIMLVALASPALMLMPGVLDVPVWLPLSASFAALLATIGIAAALGAPPARLMRSSHRGALVFRQIRDVVVRYRSNIGIVGACLALSVLFHVLNGLSLWLLALSITSDASVAIAFLWPIVGLLGMLPLTPGGLGVREGIITLLLMQTDMSPEQAVTAAVIGRILLLLCSLAGLPTLITTIGNMRASSSNRKGIQSDVGV
ncbi:MAG: lysylphosphatidylglycerol synthase transmembrane domain-containing protein [Roseiflexus sp.]